MKKNSKFKGLYDSDDQEAGVILFSLLSFIGLILFYIIRLITLIFRTIDRLVFNDDN